MSEQLLQDEPAVTVMTPQRQAAASPGSGLAPLHRLFVTLGRLRRLCPSIPVTAIHWMSLRHPIHPVQERLLSEVQDSPPPPMRALVLRWIRCVGYALYLSVLFAWLRWRCRREIAALRGRSFHLAAKTWWFGTSHSGDWDFYYGDLQQRLAERGVRMLMLGADGNGLSFDLRRWRGFIKAHGSTSEAARLPQLCLAHPAAPFRIAAGQLAASLRLRRLARRARHPLLRRASQAASWDCLAPQTAENSLCFCMTQAAVKTWRLQAFMELYEANSWERCEWRGAKAARPSCLTVGYQHGIVMPYSLSLREPCRGSHKDAVPDRVLCLGEATRTMLEPGHRPSGSRLVPFGSIRYPNAHGRPQAPRRDRRAVLVVPEGIPDEAVLLFDAALRMAGACPDHRFIFRCHPYLPFAQVRAHLSLDPDQLPNVEISPSESIEPDFARSSVVLYRGSSAVLYAVLAGLWPVYFQAPQHPELDPLFEAGPWRSRVSSAQEMAAALRAYAELSEDEVVAQWRQARAYVSGYVMPVSDASIDRFLAAVELRDGEGPPLR